MKKNENLNGSKHSEKIINSHTPITPILQYNDKIDTIGDDIFNIEKNNEINFKKSNEKNNHLLENNTKNNFYIENKEYEENNSPNNNLQDINLSNVAKAINVNNLNTLNLQSTQNDKNSKNLENFKNDSEKILIAEPIKIENEGEEIFPKKKAKDLKNIKKQKITEDEKIKEIYTKSVSFFKLQYSLSSKTENFIVIIGILGSLGTGITFPMYDMVSGWAFNSLTESIQLNFIENITQYCLYFIYIGIANFISASAMAFFWALNGKYLARKIRIKYFNYLMRQEQGFFDKSNPYEFSSKVQLQTEKIEYGLGVKVGNLLSSLTLAISGVVIGFITSWKISLVLFTIYPFLVLCALWMNSVQMEGSKLNQEAFQKAGGIAEEILYNIKTVASFCNFDNETKRFGEKLEDSLAAGLKRSLRSAILIGSFFFLMMFSNTIGISWGSTLILEKSNFNTSTGQLLKGGDVYIVLSSIIFGAYALGDCIPNIKAIMEACSSAVDFFNLKNRQPKIFKNENPKFPEKNGIIGRIFFDDVCLYYNQEEEEEEEIIQKFEENFSNDKDEKTMQKLEENKIPIQNKSPTTQNKIILNKLTLEFEAGKSTAIVGPSGSGKSTIISLIERLYDTTSGDIYIDNIKLKDYDLQYLRTLIGYVPQEPFLFNTSIKENIIFGRGNISNDDLNEACEKASVNEFLLKMDKGLDTIVGIKGGKLSGGQKQRIAIARAILTKPKFLILDEATSALDNKSEKEVQKALDNVTKGMTTIIIAHRLSTIINADKIVVLKEGKIEEIGNHESLLELGGFYASLVKSQGGVRKINKFQVKKIENKLNQQNLDINIELENFNYNRKVTEGDKYDEHSKIIINDHIIVENNNDKNYELKKSNSKISIKNEKLKQLAPDLESSMIKEAEEQKQIEEYASKYQNEKLMPIIKEQKCLLILAFISSAFSGCMFPIYGLLLAYSVDSLSSTDDNVIKIDSLMYALLFLLLAACNGVSSFLQNFSFESMGEHLTKRLRELTFNKYLRLPMSFYDTHENSPGTLLTKLSSDSANVTQLVLISGVLLQCCVTVALSITLGFIFDWRLCLIAIGFIPLMALGVATYESQAHGQNKDSSSIQSYAGSILSESVCNTKSIFSFNMQEKVVKMYSDILITADSSFVKSRIISSLTYGFSQFTMFANNATIFYAAGAFIFNGSLTFGNMVRAFLCVMMGSFSLGLAQKHISDIALAKKCLYNIFKIIDIKSDIDPLEEKNDKYGKYSPIAEGKSFKGKIEFKNIYFSYPTRKKQILYSDLNFIILPGQSAAFIGLSGSGKSTIIQLLERFYDVTSGQILIDDVDIKSYDIIELRSYMSLVSQEPILFKRSIKENIRYGKMGASDNEILEAANQAKISHKLDSENLENFENSKNCENMDKVFANVSGGEKQRIAIARAMIRDPKILLLDEATSALDKKVEEEIQKSLDEMMKGRTSIVIAHRLSTVQNCDVIFVMESGSIVEQGRHDFLMEKKGKYFELYNLGVK